MWAGKSSLYYYLPWNKLEIISMSSIVILVVLVKIMVASSCICGYVYLLCARIDSELLTFIIVADPIPVLLL